MELTDSQKRDYVEKQIQVFTNELNIYESRLKDLLLMQAQSNFYAEVTLTHASNYDKSIMQIKQQIDDVHRDLDIWINWKQAHPEIFN